MSVYTNPDKRTPTGKNLLVYLIKGDKLLVY